ncbi:N-acetyltransferase [Asanoa ishikariensis]|uniref:Protein N-acetyltransferase, RimJ/RimL family n=1 Tax=Asanoa ishikariensis TaxID=137265 RepID=A0A1H3TUU9_9ACTN|nr:GNAT family N-acetyltransferase [Asanoa ishikariensis]GIF67464.1 N-acetyltransferase [Asanoa ishikariensis]SDZ53541.1 Protein N-acetyltransferase, RimJ/RimL family [Asanoa ishikariensis]
MTEVALRPVSAEDLDVFFAQMRDPESVRMAAFTPEDPDDRAAYDAKMARILGLPTVVMRTITRAGAVVGSIASFVEDGETDVTYWIERALWGQGIAGRALAAFLDEFTHRPLYARAASDNIGSLTVLRRAGFQEIGTEISWANARQAEIEETILRLE